MAQLEVLGHRIHVIPDKVKEKTDGGIYIPDEARDREQLGAIRGTVDSVGPQAFKAFDPSGMGNGEAWIKKGDRICFAKYAGTQIEEDGVTYRVINDDDVICRIVDAKEQ